MVGSPLTVVGICTVALALYERGDGYDATFLLLFALSQHAESTNNRVFCRIFLPCLSLIQYFFKHIHTNNERTLWNQSVRHGGNGAGPTTTPTASPGSSPESSKGKTKSKSTSKTYVKGSIALSRRFLTLSLHLSVIFHTVRNPESIGSMTEEKEVVLLMLISVFIFSKRTQSVAI